jgi:hypothetical protein
MRLSGGGLGGEKHAIVMRLSCGDLGGEKYVRVMRLSAGDLGGSNARASTTLVASCAHRPWCRVTLKNRRPCLRATLQH